MSGIRNRAPYTTKAAPPIAAGGTIHVSAARSPIASLSAPARRLPKKPPMQEEVHADERERLAAHAGGDDRRDRRRREHERRRLGGVGTV